MEKIRRAGKIAVFVLFGAMIMYVISVLVFGAYAGLFLSHQTFADTFPVKESDLKVDGVLINLTDSDFVQYPVLKEVVQEPIQNRHIMFDRIQYLDKQRIADFRNKYCINRSINRYVQWNGTYYQIVIGQE